ncbi:MAG: DUF4118 domain-containing protein [Acidobacteriia bacterium]|nr:DUF4118 domain-containing protein [Terriglobia bacterium]
MAAIFPLKHLPWNRKGSSQSSGKRQRSFSMENLLLLAEWFRHESVSGSLLCGAIAIGLCILLKGSTIEAQVPILFLLVVLAISSRFGTPAGVLGTVLSAVAFAEFLFDPQRSLAIRNPVEKSNMAWMILGGLALSCLFGKSQKSTDQERQNGTPAPR